MNQLEQLVAKLNAPMLSSLEQGLAICARQGHYDLEWQHWLLAMLEQRDASVMTCFEAAGLKAERLQQTLQTAMQTFDTGNTQSPVISARVRDWLQLAWSQASLAGEQVLDAKALLLVLAEDPVMQQLCERLYTGWHDLNWSALHSLDMPSSESVMPAPTSQNALSQYAEELVALAAAGKMDPAIGREMEISQLVDILGRRRQNNAILTGEPGVGKTAIVEGLALLIANKEAPEALQQTKIYALDLARLQAGASVKGAFEQRMTDLIHAIKTSPDPIILFIDEAHNLLGAGGQAGQGDAANLLKPALARAELRCIAATTQAEYKQYFAKDAALVRRFQVVDVKEPGVESAAMMLRSLVPSLMRHHGVDILDEAVVAATQLSAQYISGRKLPDKSVSVLDTACARVASLQSARPLALQTQEASLKQNKQWLSQLQHEKSLGQKNKSACKALQQTIKQQEQQLQQQETEWQAQQQLLADYKAAITEGNQAKRSRLEKKFSKQAAALPRYVDAEMVSKVIADWTGIPLGKMREAASTRLLHLAATLQQQVLGQQQALNFIAERILASQAKLTDPNKPRGVFLLVGPSGVGKTETAMLIAEQVYGSRQNVVTLNMSEFKEAHKVSLLTGAPPGYVGYGQGGVLTEALKRQPYSLVLLDEMEKAHPSVQDMFYRLFDQGEIQDSEGTVVDCRQATIIMTSNAASAELADVAASNALSDVVDAVFPVLQKHFKSAFLGRLNVVPYLGLTDVVLKQIVQMKLAKQVERLQTNYAVTLQYGSDVVDWLATQCQQASIGARQIDNLLNQVLAPQLAKWVLLHAKQEKVVHVAVNDGALHVGLSVCLAMALRR